FHNLLSQNLLYNFSIAYFLFILFRIVTFKIPYFGRIFRHDLLLSLANHLELLSMPNWFFTIIFTCFPLYLHFIIYLKPDAYIWSLFSDFILENGIDFFRQNPTLA